MIEPKEIVQQSPTTTILQTDLLHQKFIEAALQMDASIVEPFIPEDMLLQDLDKYTFLAYLKDVFESIWQRHPEDYRVEPASFICGSCMKGHPLAAFEVYAGVNYVPYTRFAYLIESDATGLTKDIYICHYMVKELPRPPAIKLIKVKSPVFKRVSDKVIKFIAQQAKKQK